MGYSLFTSIPLTGISTFTNSGTLCIYGRFIYVVSGRLIYRAVSDRASLSFTLYDTIPTECGYVYGMCFSNGIMFISDNQKIWRKEGNEWVVDFISINYTGYANSRGICSDKSGKVYVCFYGVGSVYQRSNLGNWSFLGDGAGNKFYTSIAPNNHNVGSVNNNTGRIIQDSLVIAAENNYIYSIIYDGAGYSTQLTSLLKNYMGIVCDSTGKTLSIEYNGKVWFGNNYGNNYGSTFTELTTKETVNRNWLGIAIDFDDHDTTFAMTNTGLFISIKDNTATNISNPRLRSRIETNFPKKTIFLNHFEDTIDSASGFTGIMSNQSIQRGGKFSSNALHNNNTNFQSTYYSICGLSSLNRDNTTNNRCMGKDAFTIDMWIRPIAVQANSIIWSFSTEAGVEPKVSISFDISTGDVYLDPQNGGFRLRYFDNELSSVQMQIQFVNTNPIILSQPEYNVWDWVHVAVVRDLSRFYVFINGISQEITYTISSDSLQKDINILGNSTTLRPSVGGSTNNISSLYYPKSPFKGFMDEFRFSNDYVEWTSNFTPPTSPYSDPLP